VTTAVRVLVATLVTGLLALVLTACQGTTTEEDEMPAYDPLPDSALVAQIEELPGVAGAEVVFSDTFSGGRTYRGEVRLEPGAEVDPIATLDATYAILRQGEPNAALGVSVIDPDTNRAYNSSALDLTDSASLQERYGPQPGDGTPPE